MTWGGQRSHSLTNHSLPCFVLCIPSWTHTTGKTTDTSPKAKVAKKNSNTKAAAPPSKTDFQPNAAQAKILHTMGDLRAIGMTQPTRAQVQSFSGNTKTEAGFVKNMGLLRKHKYIVGSDTLELMPKGVAFVGTNNDPSNVTLEKFHQNIKLLLSKKGGLIFDALVDGKVHNKREVAERLGYDMKKLSGYEKDLCKMSSLGLLDKKENDIQLTGMSFPYGRPN